MKKSIIKSFNQILYAFGYYDCDPMPRPLVLEYEQWRPATSKEFIDHHLEMAEAVLLERVCISKESEKLAELEKEARNALEKEWWTERMEKQ